ncbi:hypothetical protein [Thalassospira xiamenensis]|uniref:Uncharacterized protein n=1 Tax=Thalassospira xiamenensis TaxID=220697 RepID=A0A285TSR1_9PROT|nr:hypothetical protein [Thalassospira xiamenensis]SOC27015.1 hypothetical protein SAMN05428964_105251 [Thalassospira xiamenensis]
MDFSAYFPREEYEHMQTNWGAANYGQRQELHEPLKLAVGRFLFDMAREGMLQPVSGLRHRRIRILGEWNKLVSDAASGATFEEICANNPLSQLYIRETDETISWQDIPYKLLCRYVALDMNPPNLGDTSGEARYDGLVRNMNSGTSPEFGHSRLNPQYCSNTGDDISVTFDAWRVNAVIERFLEPDASKPGGAPFILSEEPLTDAPAPVVEVIEANFPSGEVIVTSYVNRDDFNDHVELKIDDRKLPRLDSELGAIAKTKAIASELGFFTIYGPEVFSVLSKDGAIIISRRPLGDEEEKIADPDVTVLAECLSGDVHTVTIIDRAVLTDLFAKAYECSLEHAVELVDEYLRDPSSEHVALTVTPGTHYLHESYLPNEFQRMFQSDELDISQIPEVSYILANRCLCVSNDISAPSPKAL